MTDAEAGDQGGVWLRSPYLVLAAAFFVIGTTLRVSLCWVNPPSNAFDDHFAPIFMIMKTGAIPAKDACFQCYQPPVFYCVSAAAGSAAQAVGLAPAHVVKIMQGLNCVYGVLTLILIYLILARFELRPGARVAAFGVACFLPRSIYMSAVNSNDSLSYLCVAATILVTIVAVERGLSPGWAGTLGLVATVTIFCKYTAFAVLPMIVAVVIWAAASGVVSWKRAAAALLLALAPPVAVLGSYMVSNLARYGDALPWNVGMYDPSVERPRDVETINFESFRPWEFLGHPVLAPGKLHSFWTIAYSGMWFDTEPLFQCFLDSNRAWWSRYYAWYRGEAPFPGNNPAIGWLTTVTADGLVTLGLVPLALGVVGTAAWVFRQRHWATGPDRIHNPIVGGLLVLAAFNALGIIWLTHRLPVYCAMKASYFLETLPAFALFLAIGWMTLAPNRWLRAALGTAFGLQFLLAAVHILDIVAATAGPPR